MHSLSTCEHVGIWSRLVTFKTYQVSFSKYTWSVLYGGLVLGRGCDFFFAGLDNKLWFYNFNDVSIFSTITEILAILQK